MNGKFNCPDGVCRDTNAIASCGTTCQACPTKPNATASSCTNGVCGYVCNTNYFKCADGTCSRNLWDFEMAGDTQGWIAPPVAGQANPVTLSTSGVQKHGGSLSLAAMNPGSNFDMLVEAPICGSQATDLTGKKVSLWYFMDFQIFNHFPANNDICLNWYYSDGTDPSTNCGSISPGWNLLSRPVLESPQKVAAFGVELLLFSGASDSSAGTLYIDDVQITNN